MRAPWVGRLALAAILVFTLVDVLAQTRHYGLMGFDSYPILIASRVQSVADLAGTFTEPLMDTRYGGEFYRPVMNLSFALDHALWGLNPLGYQITNALLFVACGLSLFLVARRASGSASSWVVPLATLLVFLLHSTHWEIIPVPARRAELLCGTAIALSLYAQLSSRALSARRPTVLPAVLMLVAMASKETAYLFPVVSFLALLLYTPVPGVRDRLRRAVAGMSFHLVALGILLVARFIVLGGLGGHQAAANPAAPSFVTSVSTVFRLLAFPQVLSLGIGAGGWLLAAGSVGLLATGALWLARRDSVPPDRPRSNYLGAGALGLGWLLIPALVYPNVGRVEPWYLFLPVAGAAMVLGALLGGLAGLLRRSRGSLRLAVSVTLVLLIAFVAMQARHSPLLHRYDDWDRATRASRGFLDGLQATLDRTSPGTTLTAPPVPSWVPPRRGVPTVYGGAVLADYSIQAWAELVFPERKIRVARRGRQNAPVGSDEILILPTKRLRNF